MNIDLQYTLKLIEKDSLVEYKGKNINEVVFDAEYDVFFHMDNFDDEISIEHRLESIKYHPDLDEVLDSEAVTAIEDELTLWLIRLSAYQGFLVKDGMTLIVEFIDHKNGTPTYRIITETIV